jgi:uncharacterized RDD family membrane protein YckC
MEPATRRKARGTIAPEGSIVMAPNTYNAHATQRMLHLDGLRLASFRRRASAFAIDSLLIVVVVTACVAGGASVAERLKLLPTNSHIKLEFNLENWYSVASAGVYFGLFTFVGKGQTVGKRLARIRVVSTVHANISLWHSFERAFGYGASALEFGFGFFQYFIVDNRQTTHDRIAGTIVIEERGRPGRGPEPRVAGRKARELPVRGPGASMS